MFGLLPQIADDADVVAEFCCDIDEPCDVFWSLVHAFVAEDACFVLIVLISADLSLEQSFKVLCGGLGFSFGSQAEKMIGFNSFVFN